MYDAFVRFRFLQHIHIQQEVDDPDNGDGSSPPHTPAKSVVEIPGPPVVLAKRDSGSSNSSAPESQQAEGSEGGGGAVDPSTPLLQEEGRGDAAAAAAAPAAAAPRESGDEEGGVGLTGDPAAIESIQNLLLMVPVDLEKLRNLAWEKGGYQVWFGAGGGVLFKCCCIRDNLVYGFHSGQRDDNDGYRRISMCRITPIPLGDDRQAASAVRMNVGITEVVRVPAKRSAYQRRDWKGIGASVLIVSHSRRGGYCTLIQAHSVETEVHRIEIRRYVALLPTSQSWVAQLAPTPPKRREVFGGAAGCIEAGSRYPRRESN